MDLNQIISDNFKRIRAEKGLSLDDVAKLTGVSKSMLGQIARGEVNPTITTVWKIANGLKISFTALVSRPESDLELVRGEDLQPILDGGARTSAIFPFGETRRFEQYCFELLPGAVRRAEAHPQKSQEFITLFEGTLVLEIGDDRYELNAGDSIRFRADMVHTYKNRGNVTARTVMTIFYDA